jgi:ABC-2 type transport system permease protein
MNKILLIIKREYLTRVRKKMFIITTLLLPLFYVGLIFGTSYIAEKSRRVLDVAVIDQSGYFHPELLTKQNLADKSSKLIAAQIKDTTGYEEAGYDAYIIIPPFDWKSGYKLLLKARKSIGTTSTALIEAKMNRVWDDIKNEKLGIDSASSRVIENSRIGLRSENIDDPKADAATANGMGTAFGFLIYFIILIYGSQVMMGVMEEKTNRIAEIIVSSVKPFQMMLGKILGIALVALTQFFLWVAFILIIYKVTASSGGAANQIIGSVQAIFESVNLPLVFFLFAFYFLGGFFFYASIYGAIGSAINEDIREAQALSFPVTMLVIISIFIMTTAANDPTGPVAFWGSIIPFSSPIVMMARIPYGVPGTVPWWQLGLSMFLLVAGFIFTTWFAGKIYRTGILMYGKKPSWKELIKWGFRKN